MVALLLCYHFTALCTSKGDISASAIFYLWRFPLVHYDSQFTAETYCFADGRCLFKQLQSVIYHWNRYD